MADRFYPATDADAPANATPPYPPSIHAANELDPIVISQMELETHHRGKRTTVRVLEPSIRLGGALVTTVEDEQDTPVLLLLCQQPSEAFLPAEQILRVGSCYMIKEPFLTVAPDGSDSLRVDHPSDILLMSQDHELLPVALRKSDHLVKGSVHIRMEGNDAVGKKRWAEAEHLYTIAIQIAATAEETHFAYLNRSLANLHLRRPAVALEDAIKSYGVDSSARTEKGLFREASALYELAKYDQCLDRLQNLEKSYPGNNSAMAMIERVQARLREQQSGQYDFRHMHKQAEATPPLIDCANYTMPVEIRGAPGKGRGIFTTRKVLAGELLICEKAFGYIYRGKDHPGDRRMTIRYMQADLRGLILQRMSHNIEDVRSVGQLYHGDYDTVSVHEVDGRPVVDSFLVSNVARLTGFASPRTSLSHLRDFILGVGNNLDDQCTAVGIWSFASHMNHSCIGNARRSFIGDMQIVRATEDLEEGSELFVCYAYPCDFDSYDEAQKRLNQWGFTCDCALCLDRKATTNKMLMQRKSLLEDLGQLMESRARAGSVSHALKSLEKVNQTYSSAARSPGAVRLELRGPYIGLGAALVSIGRPSDAIEMTLKGLEALGFVISASPPRGRPKSRKPQLLIKQWGVANPISVNAFSTLYQAYKSIAPPLSAVARKYMETAYSMVMGEKDTFLDTFPGIA